MSAPRFSAPSRGIFRGGSERGTAVRSSGGSFGSDRSGGRHGGAAVNAPRVFSSGSGGERRLGSSSNGGRRASGLSREFATPNRVIRNGGLGGGHGFGDSMTHGLARGGHDGFRHGRFFRGDEFGEHRGFFHHERFFGNPFFFPRFGFFGGPAIIIHSDGSFGTLGCGFSPFFDNTACFFPQQVGFGGFNSFGCNGLGTTFDPFIQSGLTTGFDPLVSSGFDTTLISPFSDGFVSTCDFSGFGFNPFAVASSCFPFGSSCPVTCDSGLAFTSTF